MRAKHQLSTLCETFAKESDTKENRDKNLCITNANKLQNHRNKLLTVKMSFYIKLREWLK